MRRSELFRTATYVIAALSAISVLPATATDWPTLRHDARRSNTTDEILAAESLHMVWTHRPQQLPRPAWPGPARWDAYVQRTVMSSMRNYDESFHVTVAGDKLFFGSSADDAVHCLDVHTGSEIWHATVGGPVRLPPTVCDGRLFFGSDDGYAYCIAVDSGEPIWKFRPAAARMLINDGRLISQWPCRTGVTVADDIAYFAASLLPWETSYLCAVDAKTGTIAAAGTYVHELTKATIEGPLLVADDHLIATQGRAGPLWFTRRRGESRGALAGAQGGSFALIAEDGTRFFGPGPKEGFISESDAEHKVVIARKLGALSVLAAGNRLFALERNVLGAMQRKPEQWLWRKPFGFSEAGILAGDTLFLGGQDRVAAVRADDGSLLWEHAVDGRAQGLVVANNTLYVSTDRGFIHAFRPGSPSTDSIDPKKVDPLQPATANPPPYVGGADVPFEIRRGPLLRFVGPQTAVVRWATRSPMPTTFVYGRTQWDHRNHDDKPKLEHEVTLNDLVPGNVYRFGLVMMDGDVERIIGPFECDTLQNFTQPVFSTNVDPFAEERRSATTTTMTAEQILSEFGSATGIAVVYGSDQALLAFDLAIDSSLHIVVLESNPHLAGTMRRKLSGTGIYGAKISVILVDGFDRLPFPSNFANIVVVGSHSEREAAERVPEALRILHPTRGRLWLNGTGDFVFGLDNKELPAKSGDSPVIWRTSHPNRRTAEKRPAPGVGSWTHQYGLSNNATFAGETLSGASRTSDFEVQWIGRPGPRHQSDRENRKPAPLYSNGRLFVQGLDRLLALDAHNGVPLWSLEIPDSRRFNIRNDSSNWCADEQHLYLAARDACWKFDGATGKLREEFHLPTPQGKDVTQEWGYIGRHGGMLVGSAVKAGSAFQDFWGGKFWYTDSEGPLAANVCSTSIFGIDAATGQSTWSYHTNAIINTSITLADETVFFAESRHPMTRDAQTGRLDFPELWQNLYLVALDVTNGELKWEQPIDIGLAMTMFSLAHGHQHVAAVASARGSYRVAVFHASDGRLVWQTEFPWEAQGKGADSARPVIIDESLFVSPRAFELTSGRLMPQKLVRGACGTYAAARHVFLTRLGNLGLWSPETNQATTWDRLRPDCWLSAIPAGGLILAPEGGGGCSCGGWLETSIAFAPKSQLQP